MKKQILIIVAIAAVVFIAATAFTPSPKQGGWKNLKVLPQDISKDSLFAIMDYYKGSLGVKCGFCHAPDPATGKMNFASDEKPEKETTRYMMKMTIDINKNFFNFNNSTMPDTIRAVTCYTCHHGEPHPEAKLKFEDDHKMPPPPPGGMPPAGGAMPNDSIHKNMSPKKS